ncbi:hypothetical protein P8452_18210 [Trifolium repens]|nr:hypothetical protein QL285_061646 [Trifolium repens]KAK2431022.1 hypothetical protein QL285_029298 [Trifolium repens]KAK2452860.1 hypothetical protein QL285_000614 [Trifolium repens]WJX09761.1 hypothetical protein P8452_00561 [Trifolium repens]WJX29585.1 hypothetical protein P8452_18210 [Trifolium repens]
MKRSWFPLSETHSRNEAHSLSLKHIHSLALSETKLLHGLKLILEVQTKRIEAHSRQVKSFSAIWFLAVVVQYRIIIILASLQEASEV